jgi:hypothetical protein
VNLRETTQKKSIDDEIWLAYFSELSTVPPKFDKKIEALNKKVKELEQKAEFKSFSCLDFRIYQPRSFCAVFNNSFPIISNPGLFPFFKLQIALGNDHLT